MPSIVGTVAELSKRVRSLLMFLRGMEPETELARDPLVLVALWLLVVGVIAFIERWLGDGFRGGS